MMKLYFIRHGRQNSKLCNVNVDLSKEGYHQAALLGERLAYAQIDVVYSSDLLRAVETAQAANLYWNVEHMIEPGLREISFGDLEGLTDEEIKGMFGAFKLQQDRMEEDLAYPGGESAEDVITRVMPVLHDIIECGAGYRNVAVVTHGGLIRSLTAHLLGMDLAKTRLLGKSLENCSITELMYDSETGRYTLERFNDYAHLEAYPQLLRAYW